MDASRYWGWSADSGDGLLARNWGWFVLRGIVALAMGVMALLFPASALWAFTMVFATFAFVDGLLSVAAGLHGARRRDERHGGLILRGAIGILIGVLFLLVPGVAVISYAIATLALLAAWSVGTGVFEVAAAVRLRREIHGEWLMILSGILSILLGLAVPLLLLFYPPVAILSVAVMIGIYALAAGVVLIALGIRLRRQLRHPFNI
jgi:uncharacterized membrane protein HdeD (DUF308 family)